MNTVRAFVSSVVVFLAFPVFAFAASGFTLSFSENPLAYTASVFSTFLRLPYCYLSVTKESSQLSKGGLLSRADNVVYPGDLLTLKWFTVGMKAPVLYHDGKPSGGFERIEKNGTKTLSVGSEIAAATSGQIIETFQIGPSEDKALKDPSCRIQIKSLPAPSSASSERSSSSSSQGGNAQAGGLLRGGGSSAGSSGTGSGSQGGGFFYMPVSGVSRPESIPTPQTPDFDDSAGRKLLQEQDR